MWKKTVIVAAVSAVLSSAATALALRAPGGSALAAAAEARLPSKVLRWEEAEVTRDRWGEFRRFFAGEGAGVKDVLAAFAVVKPGEALHKAHRHAEEEFLVITEGSGTWSVAGKEFPLKKGDVLYVEPWVMHGSTNTGKEPLTFFVAKWNGKGVPVPPEPPAAKE